MSKFSCNIDKICELPMKVYLIVGKKHILNQRYSFNWVSKIDNETKNHMKDGTEYFSTISREWINQLICIYVITCIPQKFLRNEKMIENEFPVYWTISFW